MPTRSEPGGCGYLPATQRYSTTLTMVVGLKWWTNLHLTLGKWYHPMVNNSQMELSGIKSSEFGVAVHVNSTTLHPVPLLHIFAASDMFPGVTFLICLFQGYKIQPHGTEVIKCDTCSIAKTIVDLDLGGWVWHPGKNDMILSKLILKDVTDESAS